MSEQKAPFEVGIVLPNYGPRASVDGVLRVAELAEEAGFDSVWATEHLLVAEEQADPYGTVLEPLSCLSWLAGRLERVELGTSVVLVPLHQPVHLAKAAATLQQLSRGRLKLGIGAGWHEPEFRFLGYGFSDRGWRTDEALRLMRALWDGQSRFEGEYWSFQDARFGPLPEPAPQIWVGGGSARGLHRARELGDVWHPLGLTPEQVNRAKQEWPEGRVVPRYELRLTEDGERSANPMKLSGSASEVAGRICDLAGAGADGVVLSAGLDPKAAVETLRRFANEVAPRLLLDG